MENSNFNQVQIIADDFFKEKGNFLESANDWIDELENSFVNSGGSNPAGAKEFSMDLKKFINQVAEVTGHKALN